MATMEELLKKIGLDKYVPAFAAEGFTDPADLVYLVEEDWKRLIPELGFRRRLQAHLAEEQKKAAGAAPGTPATPAPGTPASYVGSPYPGSPMPHTPYSGIASPLLAAAAFSPSPMRGKTFLASRPQAIRRDGPGRAQVKALAEKVRAKVEEQVARYRENLKALAAARPVPTKRVLCLDDGGGRGIVQARFLRALQHVLEVEHADKGIKLRDAFDLVVSSGFGSLSALALWYGADMEELEKAFSAISKQVFNEALIRGLARRWFQPGKGWYNQGEVVAQLQKALAPATGKSGKQVATILQESMSESGNDAEGLKLCFTAATASADATGNYTPVRFVNYKRRQNMQMSQTPDGATFEAALRATTAMPRYFSPQIIRFADTKARPVVGGRESQVNPINDAYEEARRLWEEANLIFVSIGTSTATADWKSTQPGGIIQAPLCPIAAHHAHHKFSQYVRTAQSETENTKYARLPQPDVAKQFVIDPEGRIGYDPEIGWTVDEPAALLKPLAGQGKSGAAALLPEVHLAAVRAVAQMIIDSWTPLTVESPTTTPPPAPVPAPAPAPATPDRSSVASRASVADRGLSVSSYGSSYSSSVGSVTDRSSSVSSLGSSIGVGSSTSNVGTASSVPTAPPFYM